MELATFSFPSQGECYNTFLGGDRSIQLSYEDLYEKFANKQINQLWNCWFYVALANEHLPFEQNYNLC